MQNIGIYINPPQEVWPELCKRAEQDNSAIAERVEAIVGRVASEGDAALYDLAAQIDGVKLDSLAVAEEEFLQAEQKVSAEVKGAIEVAVKNITAFHRAQMPACIEVDTSAGVKCIQACRSLYPGWYCSAVFYGPDVGTAGCYCRLWRGGAVYPHKQAGTGSCRGALCRSSLWCGEGL